mmetsp:Transcript_29728/g.81408  ORF Transcript_29728/g.81408 Transcript_29728/m.81408 type:complete len:209 (+) Transcript_29728:112-738(+)
MAGSECSRFRLEHPGTDVNEHELLEALTEQLNLDDVKLVAGSIQEVPDGVQVAEVELPDEEAEILRGPYREAKIYIRRTIIVRFTELPNVGGKATPIRTGSTQSTAPPISESTSVTSCTTNSESATSSKPFLASTNSGGAPSTLSGTAATLSAMSRRSAPPSMDSVAKGEATLPVQSVSTGPRPKQKLSKPDAACTGARDVSNVPRSA